MAEYARAAREAAEAGEAIPTTTALPPASALAAFTGLRLVPPLPPDASPIPTIGRLIARTALLADGALKRRHAPGPT